jgi:hypothetical protein
LLFSPDVEFSRYLFLITEVFYEEPLLVDELEELIVELPLGVGPFNEGA